jgi:N-acetylmuramoyl-L-alanine amidase
LQKKIVSFMLFVCLFCLQGFAGAEAQAATKITQFHYATVKDVLQIEIGLSKENPGIALQVGKTNPSTLVLDLKQAQIGSIKKQIAMDGKIAQAIEFKQIDRSNGQMVISLTQPAASLKYKMYTLPADRKAGKPFRVVVEIRKIPVIEGFSADNVNGKTIVIDPGHGGSDTGAVGPDGIMEKDVTLAVALKVEALLNASGAHVVMTRDADCDVYGPGATDRQELQARVDVGANTPGADVFLSIHANAFTNQQANGTAAYYYAKTGADGVLAQSLQSRMVQYGGLYDRGTSEANFYVMKHSAMPASLVEMAFISNPNEENLLASDDFQDKIARGICLGLNDYFGQIGN